MMNAMTLGLSAISTSSNANRSLRARSASSTVLYCVLRSEAGAPTARLGRRNARGRCRRCCAVAWRSLGPADREHSNRNAVELVKAPPGSSLRKALVDLAHGLVVHLVAAIEDVALHSNCTRKVLDRLRLARACVADAAAAWGV